MVRISKNYHPLLRRPFSIHFAYQNSIEIFFQTTGIGTALLSQKRAGDTLDILGPLGKGFNLEGNFLHKETTIIGGGRGIAPLYFLAQSLQVQKAEVKIFYGGKTRDDLPLRARFESNGYKLFCSTEDGSYKFKGMITDLFLQELKNFNPDFVFACGPGAMLEEITRISQDEKIPAELSLEALMGCGFGACWGCVQRIKKGKEEEWTKICEEGPVFPAGQVMWPKEEND
jgi:dihydroorotate dehydrogenase electron transfer subunit